MSDPLTLTSIISELIARPAQSRFAIASHLNLAPSALESPLRELEEQGLLVSAPVAGRDDPAYWASETAAEVLSESAAGGKSFFQVLG